MAFSSAWTNASPSSTRSYVTRRLGFWMSMTRARSIGVPIRTRSRVIDIQKPNLRVTYDLEEEGPALIEAIEQAIAARQAG